jgi:hypothetical protein
MLICYASFLCEMPAKKKQKVEKPPILGASCKQWIVWTQDQECLLPF